MKKLFTFLLVAIAMTTFFTQSSKGQTTYEIIYWDNHTHASNVPYCACDSIKCVPPTGATGVYWAPALTTHGDTLVLESGFDGQVNCFYTGGPKSLRLRPLSVPIAPSFSATNNVCGIEMITLDAENYSPYGFNQYTWSNGATTQTITTGAGTYMVTITNLCGSIDHSTVITEYNSNEPNLGNDFVVCQGTSVPLDPGSGYSEYLWLPGNSTDTVLYPTVSGTYIVQTTNTSDGCIDRDTIQGTFLAPPSQEIGLVTIDTTNGNNRITWSDTYDEGATVNIYRELTTNNYVLVGSAPYADGTWTDTVSSKSQPWKYKIAIVDTCGNEGALSLYVQSIKSWVISVSGGFVVQWTPYEVENKSIVSQYNIYTGSSLSNLNYLTFVAGSVNVYELSTFVDSIYVIGAQLSNKSSGDDALSNWVAQSDLTGIADGDITKLITVYPTLTDGPVTIKTNLMIQEIKVYTGLGQEFLITRSKDFILPSHGLYLIYIVTDQGTMKTKVFVY